MEEVKQLLQELARVREKMADVPFDGEIRSDMVRLLTSVGLCHPDVGQARDSLREAVRIFLQTPQADVSLVQLMMIHYNLPELLKLGQGDATDMKLAFDVADRFRSLPSRARREGDPIMEILRATVVSVIAEHINDAMRRESLFSEAEAEFAKAGRMTIDDDHGRELKIAWGRSIAMRAFFEADSVEGARGYDRAGKMLDDVENGKGDAFEDLDGNVRWTDEWVNLLLLQALQTHDPDRRESFLKRAGERIAQMLKGNEQTLDGVFLSSLAEIAAVRGDMADCLGCLHRMVTLYGNGRTAAFIEYSRFLAKARDDGCIHGFAGTL